MKSSKTENLTFDKEFLSEMFQYPIESYLHIRNIYVVMLKIPTNIELSTSELNNIYGVDENAEICWRIQDSSLSLIHENKDIGIIESRKPIYVAMWLEGEENLVIRTFNGYMYIVDYKTGLILEEVKQNGRLW